MKQHKDCTEPVNARQELLEKIHFREHILSCAIIDIFVRDANEKLVINKTVELKPRYSQKDLSVFLEELSFIFDNNYMSDDSVSGLFWIKKKYGGTVYERTDGSWRPIFLPTVKNYFGKRS